MPAAGWPAASRRQGLSRQHERGRRLEGHRRAGSSLVPGPTGCVPEPPAAQDSVTSVKTDAVQSLRYAAGGSSQMVIPSRPPYSTTNRPQQLLVRCCASHLLRPAAAGSCSKGPAAPERLRWHPGIAGRAQGRRMRLQSRRGSRRTLGARGWRRSRGYVTPRPRWGPLGACYAAGTQQPGRSVEVPQARSR